MDGFDYADDLLSEIEAIERGEERFLREAVDWQPFSGHFLQRLRPAFLNSTGLM